MSQGAGIPSPPPSQVYLGKRKRGDEKDDNTSELFVSEDEEEQTGDGDDISASEDGDDISAPEDGEDISASEDGDDISASEDGADEDYGADVNAGADESADDVDEEDSNDDESDDAASDDMDEDNEETNDPDYSYSEATESLPQYPCYDAEIPRIEADALNLLLEVQEVLGRQKCESSVISAFKEKAKALEKIPAIPAPVIALLGASGSGKSSSTNSVTDVPELAKTGAIGRAITAVASEYKGPFASQKTRCMTRAEFFNEQEIQKLLTEQVGNYCLYAFNKNKKWSKEAKLKYEARAKTAIEILTGLFRDIPEFGTARPAKQWLAANNPSNKDELDSLIKIMMDWTKQLLADRDGVFLEDGRHVECFEADSIELLRKDVDQITTPTNKRRQPMLWPLVRKTSTGIQDCRILEHIILADLPGFGDSCQVRVQQSTEYLTDCDHIWIVASCTRVVTDVAVLRFFEKYGERFRDKIIIIATGADDIEVTKDTADQLVADGHKPENFKLLTKQAAPLERQIVKLTAKISSCTNSQKKQEFEEEKAKVQIQLDPINNQRYQSLVKARNLKITRELERIFQRFVDKARKLPVFMVSNRQYAMCKGALAASSPQLTVDATNIPALRNYALGLPAPALMQNLEFYIDSSFGVFLTGLELWARSEHVKSPEQLRQIVDKPKSVFEGMIASSLRDIGDQARCQITKPLAAKHESFANLAHKEVKALQSWHWCTLKSFILNNGAHETSLVGPQNWNDKFMKPAVKEIIKPGWRALERESQKMFVDLDLGLYNMLYSILTDLGKEADAVKLPLMHFSDLVEAQIRGIKTSANKHRAAYLKELAKIKFAATQDCPQGYFHGAMETCYVESQNDGGTGYKARVIGRFQNMFSLRNQASPFTILGQEIEKAIMAAANLCAANVTKDFNKVLDQLRSDFDKMIADGKPDPSEVPVREVLKVYLGSKAREIQGIKDRLKVVKGKPEYKHCLKN
ncbi:hypothetical protein LTR86_000555 [Recurvomyces mirabilis]|nr:hypothetical protein LTR86_000555 [Recurvomyces mirabilis]